MKLKKYAQYTDKVSFWLTVSEEEALHIIASLSSQLRTKNPNLGRLESFLEETSDYFTIAVDFKKEGL